ncbi:hypothetical protein HID58_001996, partial [Brassica napus]
DLLKLPCSIETSGGARGCRRRLPLLSLFPFCSDLSSAVCAVDMLGPLGRALPRDPLQLLRGVVDPRLVASVLEIQSGGVFVWWRRVLCWCALSLFSMRAGFVHGRRQVCCLSVRAQGLCGRVAIVLMWFCVCILGGVVKVCRLWLSRLRLMRVLSLCSLLLCIWLSFCGFASFRLRRVRSAQRPRQVFCFGSGRRLVALVGSAGCVDGEVTWLRNGH